MTTTFDSLMNQVIRKGDRYSVEMPANWRQGRASFGGAVGALGVRAMQLDCAGDRPLRSLQVSFIGPVGDDEITIAVQQLRAGKSVTHLQATLFQQDQAACVVNACFGEPRQSVIDVPAAMRPKVKGPEGIVDLPYIPGATPDFTRNFNLRWAKGAFPFSGACEPVSGIWARFKESVPASILHLIAVGDIPPTPVSTYLKKPAPLSSLSWMLDIIVDDLQADADGWWYVETTVDHAAEGYAHQGYSIYEPNGRLVALGRQVATVFG